MVVTGQPVAPPPGQPGTGLCVASRVSTNPALNFPQDEASFPGGVNAFLEANPAARSTSVLRTPLDLSNNLPSAEEISFGDFKGAVAGCPFGGCSFPIGSGAFASRLRGYLSIPQEFVGRPLHFGFYTDDAVYLVIYDRSFRSYVVANRPPQLGAPTWRLTNSATFQQAGLYPVEILYTQITEHAALEVSVFDGSFSSGRFERPANDPPIINLAASGFTLLQAFSFYHTESGRPSFPDNLGQCQQCDRRFANQPGNNECPAGYYCNGAALCAPCDSAAFCGDACSPCGLSTPYCLNRNARYQCVQCTDDAQCPNGRCDPATNECRGCNDDGDCPTTGRCDTATNTCSGCNDDGDCGPGRVCDLPTNTCVQCNRDSDCPQGQVCATALKECRECNTDAQCPRGESCSNHTCTPCSTSESCAGASCNCCPQGLKCGLVSGSSLPTCVECTSDADCSSGQRCDTANGRCTAELPSCGTSDRCGPDCMRCPDERPYCLDGRTCVECRSDTECGNGRFCLSGACFSCTEDRRCGTRCEACSGAMPFCKSSGTAESSSCVQCLEDEDCGSGGTCNRATNTCSSGCSVTCPAGRVCSGSECVECLADVHCPCGGTCDTATRTCSSSCNDGSDCLGVEYCSPTTLECERGRQRPLTESTGGIICCSTSPEGTHSPGRGTAAVLLLTTAGLLFALRRKRSSLLVLALAAALAAPRTSSAEQGRFDVQAFRPSGAPQDLVIVSQSRPLSHLSLSGGTFLNLSFDPLVLVTVGSRSKAVSIVGNRLQLDAVATVGLFDWAEFGVIMPLVLAQSSDNLEAIGTEGFIRSFVPGDLRLQTKVAVPGLRRRAEDSGWGAALTFGTSLPTGSQEAFASDGAVTWSPGLVVDYRFDSGWLVSLNAGMWMRPTIDFLNVRWGNSITAGIATEAPILRKYGITFVGSLFGSSPLDRLPRQQFQQIPAEFLLGLRWYSSTGLTFTLGGGGGCSCSLTAPTLRFFSSLIWVPAQTAEWAALERFKEPPQPPPPPPPDPDPDGDTLIGTGDHCPTQPGPVGNDGCPDTDKDQDGVVDRLDRCQEVPAGPRGREGCPLAYIKGNKIIILEQVQFATDQDIVLAESYPTLNEVAKILREHPEIQQVLVEGHTDNVGRRGYNYDLSYRRATNVVRHLLMSGVAYERLCWEGFGFDIPSKDNGTESGKAVNRRVEFTIQPPFTGRPPACLKYEPAWVSPRK